MKNPLSINELANKFKINRRTLQKQETLLKEMGLFVKGEKRGGHSINLYYEPTKKQLIQILGVDHIGYPKNSLNETETAKRLGIGLNTFVKLIEKDFLIPDGKCLRNTGGKASYYFLGSTLKRVTTNKSFIKFLNVKRRYIADSPDSSLKKLFPEVSKWWCVKKNLWFTNRYIFPEEIKPSVQRQFWWICPNEKHEFKDFLRNRVNRSNKEYCPVCNSLAFSFPDICKEWHPVLNGKKSPWYIDKASGGKVWWQCRKCNSSWLSSPKKRGYGQGCSYCAGKSVNETNALSSLSPSIAKEWHPTKNGKLSPSLIAAKSGKSVFWLCRKCGDEWKAVIKSRVDGARCKVCLGIVPTKDNNLVVKFPEIALQWHPSKNGEKKPEDFLPGSSSDLIWWVCSTGRKDHIWPARIKDRTRGIGCPFCSGQKVCKSNSLLATHPLIAEEWDFDKNEKKPWQIMRGDNRKYFWICKICGKDFMQSPNYRTCGKAKPGCPTCKLVRKSTLELSILFELKLIFPKIDPNGLILFIPKSENKFPYYEYDIYIPEIKLAIEYDSYYYHKGEKQFTTDKRKTLYLKKKGYDIIRIREMPLITITEEDIIVKNNPKALDVALSIFKFIQANFNLNDTCHEQIQKYCIDKKIQNKKEMDYYFSSKIRESLQSRNA